MISQSRECSNGTRTSQLKYKLLSSPAFRLVLREDVVSQSRECSNGTRIGKAVMIILTQVLSTVQRLFSSQTIMAAGPAPAQRSGVLTEPRRSLSDRAGTHTGSHCVALSSPSSRRAAPWSGETTQLERSRRERRGNFFWLINL